MFFFVVVVVVDRLFFSLSTSLLKTYIPLSRASADSQNRSNRKNNQRAPYNVHDTNSIVLFRWVSLLLVILLTTRYNYIATTKKKRFNVRNCS